MPQTTLSDETREKLGRDLSLMMRSVGLGDIPLSELGGNHPGLSLKSEIKPETKRRPGPNRRAAAAQSAEDVFVELPAVDNKAIDPIEQARRIERLMARENFNVTAAAHHLGRSRAYVRNHIRLLNLPQKIQDHVKEGRLTEGHARAIAKMRDPEAMARLIIKRQLSVRAAELMARRLRYIDAEGRLTRETAIPNTRLAEHMIESALGCKAEVKDRAGRGKLVLHYKSPDEFQNLVGGLVRVFSGLEGDINAGDL